MQEAAHSAMEELTSKSGFQDLSKGMDDAEVRWLKNWQTMQAKAIDSINAVEDRIDKMISKDRTVYVNVKETQSRATGGLIGAQRLATGGSVTRMGNMMRGGFFLDLVAGIVATSLPRMESTCLIKNGSGMSV